LVKANNSSALHPRLIETSLFEDDRGHFSRLLDSDWLPVDTQFIQISESCTRSKGTFRGFHYLTLDQNEWKAVTCISGEIMDILIDVRPNSPEYGSVTQYHLSSTKRASLLIPPGFAHGYLTLSSDVRIIYGMTCAYDSEHERGVRWNDPRINLKLPIAVQTVSSKDLNWPLLKDK